MCPFLSSSGLTDLSCLSLLTCASAGSHVLQAHLPPSSLASTPASAAAPPTLQPQQLSTHAVLPAGNSSQGEGAARMILKPGQNKTIRSVLCPSCCQSSQLFGVLLSRDEEACLLYYSGLGTESTHGILKDQQLRPNRSACLYGITLFASPVICDCRRRTWRTGKERHQEGSSW